jgi:hypothetical protein
MRMPTLHRVGHVYRRHFGDNPRRERLFLSSVAFTRTWGATRAITHAIRRGIGPFHNVGVGGRHIHHLVFGIAGLLGSGYLWLIQVGTGGRGGDDRLSRLTTVLYGSGAALTLDEFALWLNLEDVYWAREGRESIDAVVFFGALLSCGVWGGPFLRELAQEMHRL